MVLSLINSYSLTSSLLPIKARKASYEELSSFHSTDYLDHCAKAGLANDLEKVGADAGCDAFGLGNDLTRFMGVR